MSMSLMKILNDPSLLFDNERLAKKIEEVKKDKQGLTNAASSYNVKYQREIEEGTKKAQLLIEDGKRRGLKEEDIFRGSFMPTVRTPILNFLYFMLREENVDAGFEESRQKYNKQYGHLQDEYVAEDTDNLQAPPEMETFIYGNMTRDQFVKIKKLKALSRSSNENEAFIAYRMCLELCERYGLEMDKIPCNVEKR
jgi:hypothetical protein